MSKSLKFVALSIALLGMSWGHLASKAEHTGSSSIGAKGAKIYCFMRTNGNDHQVSWNASYALIKRQSNSIFKTSPTHAAVMITESVVRNPNDYENCGTYLGDLFGNKDRIESIENKEDLEEENSSKSSVKDRYNY